MLPMMDRTTRQKTNEDIEDLNNTINQLDLIEMSGPFHPATAEYIVFLSTHENFPGQTIY